MFGILWSEIKSLLRGSKAVFILSIMAFTCSCLAINMTIYKYNAMKNAQQAYEESYGDKVFYRVRLPGESEVYQRIFGKEYKERIKTVFEQLKNDQSFQYRYTSEATIDFFNASDRSYGTIEYPAYKNECLSGYEKGSVRSDYLSLKAFSADHLFITEPNVKLASGEWFSDKDFYIDDPNQTNLPVILGSAYQGLYKIGDKISNAHIGTEKTVTLRVTGFFERNSSFYDNNNEKQLTDRYIVFPSPEITYDYNVGGNNSYFTVFYDSTKIVNARIVCNNKDADRVFKRVYSIFTHNKLYEFELMAESESWAKSVKALRSQTISSMIISIFIFFLSTLMFSVQMHYKLLTNKKKYGIYLMSGITKKQLFIIMLMDTLLLFLFSNVLFVFLNDILRIWRVSEPISNHTIIVIMTMEFILLSFMGSLGYKKVNHMDMSSTLREKE